MAHKRRSAEKRCDEVLAYINEYAMKNGYSPTFREVGNAIGIRSASTISRYIHQLIEDGRVSLDESKPRTLSTGSASDSIETVHRRICLELADGGRIYMDYNLKKPKSAPVTISFDGILDANSMKGRVGEIVRCKMNQE